MTRKVCVVVTARPSYSRIRSVLTALSHRVDTELQLVVAASALLDRYGSVVDQITSDGFEIDASVYMVLEGENPTSMAKTTGLGMLELATAFDNLRPDVVVTIADRYETLATATAAAYMNIPVAHIQGGEVSGSIDEKVRHAVTKLSDIHFTATQLARERVIRMGEDAHSVYATGCPSIDLAAEVLTEQVSVFDPVKRYGGVGPGIDAAGDYIVVMQHPVTTEHEVSASHIRETLHAVSDSDMPAMWFWPNVDAGSDGTSKGIRSFRELHDPGAIHFFMNMSPKDFLRVLMKSQAIVGNSSVAIREASFLGVPAVNIGSRQQGRERGENVVDVGYDRNEINEALTRQIRLGRLPSDPLYGDGSAGDRIARLLATSSLTVEKRLSY